MKISKWGLIKTRSLFALILIPLRIDATLTRTIQSVTRTHKPSSWTSAPDDVAVSLITPSPRINIRAIVGRESLDTCAYVSGNPASPLTCESGYTCTSPPSNDSGWACCDQVQCIDNYAACFDHGVDCSFGEELCSNGYLPILRCSESSPSCVTYIRSEVPGGFLIRTSMSCAESGGTIQVLPNTTPEKGNGNQATRVPGGNSAPNIWPSSSKSNDGVDAISSSAVGSVDQSPINESQSRTENSNELSKVEITGIVIPVVAMIVAVIVAWWRRDQVVWLLTCSCCRHRRLVRPSGVAENQLGSKINSKENDQRPRPEFSGHSLTINLNSSNQHHVMSEAQIPQPWNSQAVEQWSSHGRSH